MFLRNSKTNRTILLITIIAICSSVAFDLIEGQQIGIVKATISGALALFFTWGYSKEAGSRKK